MRNSPGVLIAAFVLSVWALMVWPWLFIPALAIGALCFFSWLGKQAAEWDQAQAARAQAIAERADRQHRAALAGDPAGTHGAYPPAV